MGQNIEIIPFVRIIRFCHLDHLYSNLEQWRFNRGYFIFVELKYFYRVYTAPSFHFEINYSLNWSSPRLKCGKFRVNLRYHSISTLCAIINSLCKLVEPHRMRIRFICADRITEKMPEIRSQPHSTCALCVLDFV